MNAVADRPSVGELEQLSDLLRRPVLDRPGLGAVLRQIEQGLRERAHDLDQAGGLLDEADKARRMSLAREDDRLRNETADLLANVDDVLRMANVETDDELVRRRGRQLLAGLRGHRNAEASLLLESTATEVGSGD